MKWLTHWKAFWGRYISNRTIHAFRKSWRQRRISPGHWAMILRQSCRTIQIFLLESLSFEKAKLWRKCLSLAQKKRACRQIRPCGNLLHQDRRYHCLHRQEYEYAETRGAALRSHERPKRAEIPHFSRSIAQRSFHQFWCALWCKGAELSCHQRGTRAERGRVHTEVQTHSEHTDTHGSRLAEIWCAYPWRKGNTKRHTMTGAGGAIPPALLFSWLLDACPARLLRLGYLFPSVR